MTFHISRAYDNVPYLESDSRVYQIVFSEETFEYQLIFGDTGDVIVSDNTFDLLVRKAEKKLLEKIAIAPQYKKIFLNFYESTEFVKKSMNEEESSKKIKAFVKKEKMNGSKIELDITSKRAFVTDPLGKKTTVKGKEFDSYIDEFSESPVSEDQTLDFEDYLLYKVLTK
jgi:hypothetical protein